MTRPVPRIRKQRARRRVQEAAKPATNEHDALLSSDSNALEILPSHVAEREERRLKLRDELRAQKQKESRMNPKKKKRLDKYIDNKLRKEENLDLIKKLAAQQIDTSLLRTSKRLGTGHETNRERLGRVLREKRAGINVGSEEDILWEKSNHSELDIVQSEGREEDGKATKDLPSRFNESLSSTNITLPRSAPPSFGSGLKRPLEMDSSGKPVVQRRKRMKVQPKEWQSSSPASASVDEDSSEWEGCDSELGNSDELETLNDESEGRASELEEMDSEDLVHDVLTSDAQSSDYTERKSPLLERTSAFKSWASKLRNDAIGFVPTTNVSLEETSDAFSISATQQSRKVATTEAKVKPDVVPEAMSAVKRKVFNVPVERPTEINQSRLALPVVAEEQTIMEAIYGNDIVILWGATGSGKTTQVPQFLFEAGYGNPKSQNPGMIGITQPRRVAAVGMATRVSVELGDQGDKVSYQIRYDSTVKKDTAMKFMTDGVLLREIGQDFTLSKYSTVIIDEAHERSTNTDILIGMLSRIVGTRSELSRKSDTLKPLKLVIMSATLRTTDLIGNKVLFPTSKPPVIKAEGRQFTVTMHFSRTTKRDYLEETFQKVKRGHKKLPRGAMLVFLTGQSEIQSLAERLKRELPSTTESENIDWQVRTSAAEAAIEDEDLNLDKLNVLKKKQAIDHESDSEPEITGLDDDDDEFNVGDETDEFLKIHVLPLYSQLPTDQQMKVFQKPPERSRLIVLATNVAETSLTIPDVKYVFDCGRVKEKRYDKHTGVQSFDVGWISKASANQRAGRAGRTAPGHCYRLYSSAVYERDFAEFATPEILRMPIEGVVLQLKSLGIPHVTKFPFPTAPDRLDLMKAEELLHYLGALSSGQLTDLGRELVVFPLSPRLSKIIAMAQKHGLTDRAIALVAALAVGDLFVLRNQLAPNASHDNGLRDHEDRGAPQTEQQQKEYNAFHGHLARLDRRSDAMKLLTTMLDFSEQFDPSSKNNFIHFIKEKSVKEAQQLRRQLSDIVTLYKPELTSTSVLQHQFPNSRTVKALNYVVAAGYIDQVAIRADLSPTPPQVSRKPQKATDVAYIPLFPSSPPDMESILSAQDDEKVRLEAETRLKSVYIHPSSVLAHTSPSKLPPYLIYSHLSRPSNAGLAAKPIPQGGKIPKTRLHPLTPITAEQIVTLATGTPLIEDGKPIGKIEMLNRDSADHERRRVYCVPFLRPGKDDGGLGWPLPPARRVIQRRDRTRGWVVENVEC